MINDITEKILSILKRMDINVEDNEADFITENNIDSITFIEIILSIEEEFSILVPDEYLIMEETNTVSKIAAFVDKIINGDV
mgnify:CR=1 FL=1